MEQDNGRLPRSRVRTWLLLPLLLAYMGLLLLAGCPTEVRPSLLDAAHHRAVRTLRLGGVMAGQPLFHTDAGEWKQRALCLKVRARTPGGPPTPVYLPDIGCRTSGFFWRLPPVDRATHRILSAAWDESTGGDATTEGSARKLESLGRYFCNRARRDGVAADEVEVAWYWFFVRYSNGEVSRYNALHFGFDCADSRIFDEHWKPDDQAMTAFWGAPPWR